MASRNLEKALGARTDLRQMARLLAAAGRGNDRLLAHISPREAAILKASGGSGTVHPQTGILEFDDSGSYNSYQTPDYSLSAGMGSATGLQAPSTGSNYSGNQYTSPDYGLSAGYSSQPQGFGGGTGLTTQSGLGLQAGTPNAGATFGPSFDTGATYGAQMPSTSGFDLSAGTPSQPAGLTLNSTGVGMTAQPAGTGLQANGIGGDQLVTSPVNPASPTGQPSGNAPAPKSQSFLGKIGSGLESALTSPATLTKILGAGIGGVGAGYLSNRAAQNALQTGQQYGAQYKQLGAPLIAQGQNLIAMGQSGQLLPSQQAALQAQKAQIQQDLASRGVQSGTAAQQAQAIINNQAQQYSQQLVQQGLQMLQLGNSYAAQGIGAEYASDQQAQNLSAQFASELGNLFAGAFNGGGTQPAQPTGAVTVQQ